MERSGGPMEVPGESWRLPWKRSKAFFLEVKLRWFCQRSKQILTFSVLGRFVKRSVVIGSCYLFVFFDCFSKLVLLRNSEVNVL